MAEAKGTNGDKEIPSPTVEGLNLTVESWDRFTRSLMSALDALSAKLQNLESRVSAIQTLHVQPNPYVAPTYQQPTPTQAQQPPQAPQNQPQQPISPAADLAGDIAGTAAHAVGGPLAGKAADALVDRIASAVIERISESKKPRNMPVSQIRKKVAKKKR